MQWNSEVLSKCEEDRIIFVLMQKNMLFLCYIVNYCTAARTKTCSECIQVGTGCAYCPDEVKIQWSLYAVEWTDVVYVFDMFS